MSYIRTSKFESGIKVTEQESIDTIVSEIIMDSYFKANELINHNRFDEAKTYIGIMEQDMVRYIDEISEALIKSSSTLYNDITSLYNSEYMIHLCNVIKN